MFRKVRKHYHRGELAREILMLFLVGGLVVSCVAFPGMAHVLKLMDTKNSRERDRVRQSVRGLRRKGLVIRRVKNGREELVVTGKGRRKLAGYLIDDLEIKRPKKWDKKWRVLMFDIPETKKHVRNEVSFKLKDIGMSPVQNSVFVSPFPCKKEIDFISQHYFIEDYLIYLEADTIESKANLVRHFHLTRGYNT